MGFQLMGKFIRPIILYVLLLLAGFGADAAKPKKQPTDTVGIQCRGVMESFPKVSEGLSDRLDYYVSEGYTHYFYSPSDDRYCNRWGWKFLYNDSDRHAVRAIRTLCESKDMAFVWTLSTGDSFRWNGDDYKFLLDKLVMMYYNGIRSFAVNFSADVDGVKSVRDSLIRDFVATRPEEVELYMVDAIAVAGYPSEGASAVESFMKGYHFDDAFKTKAKNEDAVICNVAASDEFAKIALVSVADFARDPKTYSTFDSMTGAVKSLHGESKEALVTFLKHTGEEDAAGVNVFTLDKWTQEKADSLYKEFEKIESVPALMRRSTGGEIISALEPWLAEFGRLGTRGKKVLKCMEHFHNGRLGAFWQTYLTTVMTEEERASYAKYPVGENMLHPFCEEAMTAMKEGFTSVLTGNSVLHNLASTLYAAPNAALDSDFTTSVHTKGHLEFAIPAEANTCCLLTGTLPAGKQIIFRQLKTDGSLVAEFIVRSPYTRFDIKEGAVKVDILGDVEVYENIFVYL